MQHPVNLNFKCERFLRKYVPRPSLTFESITAQLGLPCFDLTNKLICLQRFCFTWDHVLFVFLELFFLEMAGQSKFIGKKPAMSTKKASLKRPAAAGATINGTIEKLQRGISKIDVETGDDGRENPHEESDNEDKRDKAKGQKYAKMKKELPAHVLDLVEKESLKAASPRDFKTKVINRMFKRNKQGKLELNLEDQVFEEHKEIYTRRFAKEQDHAMPASIMKGLYFANDQTAFDRALASGDIVEVDCGDGKTMYSYTSYKKGIEHGNKQGQTLTGKAKMKSEHAKVLGEAFEKVGWDWDYKSEDVKKLEQGKVIPKSILNLVNQAYESQQRLGKDAMALIKSWKGDPKDEALMKLRKGHAVCGQNMAKLAHMRDFAELPDDLEPTKANLDEIMKTMALHTKEYNTLIETSKGKLKSLRNWGLAVRFFGIRFTPLDWCHLTCWKYNWFPKIDFCEPGIVLVLCLTCSLGFKGCIFELISNDTSKVEVACSAGGGQSTNLDCVAEKLHNLWGFAAVWSLLVQKTCEKSLCECVCVCVCLCVGCGVFSGWEGIAIASPSPNLLRRWFLFSKSY